MPDFPLTEDAIAVQADQSVSSLADSSQSGLLLTDFWYPALWSNQVRGRKKLAKALLLGIPMVVGRDEQGRAFAMRDSCPHRGMPLSYGAVYGQQIECPYHGWKFDVHSGTCREIPSLTADSGLNPEKIHAIRYPCEERDGYIWVFVPERRSSSGVPPPVPALPVHSARYRITYLAAELPCNVDHGVIGLMDPAHGPFVHQSWWWRKRASIHEKQKTFEPIPMGFRIATHTPSANSGAYKLLRFYGDSISTSIEFTLPNIRVEQIRIGDHWLTNRAIVVPIDANRSRIEFSAAWNIFPWFPLAKQIFNIFGRIFIRQDQLTMERQAEGLKHAPSLMLIDDADRLAKWYFALKSAYLTSKRSGAPMQHPIKGPTTLRWRS